MSFELTLSLASLDLTWLIYTLSTPKNKEDEEENLSKQRLTMCHQAMMNNLYLYIKAIFSNISYLDGGYSSLGSGSLFR